MPLPLITLTTDFGLSDHYTGVMKGVIAGIAPGASIIDICHQITPFSIIEAAYTIAQSYRYFPKGTIHVVVVDPGVGTSRRPILVHSAGQHFIGPDNGVFSFLFDKESSKVRVLANAKYFLQDVSNTFHGRDIFAPVAAHLARGTKPAQLGKLISDAFRLSGLYPTRTGKRVWTGMVLKTDQFGNLITNLPFAEFAAISTRPFQLLLGMHSITRFASSYQQAEFGEPFAIAGSSGYIEVSVCEASAAKALGCGTGTSAELTVW